MKIDLQKVGKRFNREWIFRKLTYSFESGKQYAITGPNGSGKSTLLQVIAGATLQSEGNIIYTDAQKIIEQPFLNISVAAPYMELIEEMTAIEILQFHATFKNFSVPHTVILEKCALTDATNKQIRYFSSGMKQRLKLGMAFYTESSLLLLDEPTTNLDQQGIDLYHHLIQSQTNGKTVIISSNDKEEYSSCNEVLSIADYKAS